MNGQTTGGCQATARGPSDRAAIAYIACVRLTESLTRLRAICVFPGRQIGNNKTRASSQCPHAWPAFNLPNVYRAGPRRDLKTLPANPAARSLHLRRLSGLMPPVREQTQHPRAVQTDAVRNYSSIDYLLKSHRILR